MPAIHDMWDIHVIFSSHPPLGPLWLLGLRQDHVQPTLPEHATCHVQEAANDEDAAEAVEEEGEAGVPQKLARLEEEVQEQIGERRALEAEAARQAALEARPEQQNPSPTKKRPVQDPFAGEGWRQGYSQQDLKQATWCSSGC